MIFLQYICSEVVLYKYHAYCKVCKGKAEKKENTFEFEKRIILFFFLPHSSSVKGKMKIKKMNL